MNKIVMTMTGRLIHTVARSHEVARQVVPSSRLLLLSLALMRPLPVVDDTMMVPDDDGAGGDLCCDAGAISSASAAAAGQDPLSAVLDARAGSGAAEG